MIVVALAIAILLVVFYLIDVTSFARRLRTDDEGAWISLGRPDVFSARAQDSYLKIILGFRKLPEDISTRYSSQLIRLRILLALGLVAMAWLFIVTY